MKIYRLVLLSTILICQNVTANTMLREISDSVQSVCMAPNTLGKKWDVEFLASGDVNVGLKLAGKAGADAKVAFSKSEWNGVQQVLKEQQSSENANYRKCAENVTKIFMDKLSNDRGQDLILDDDSKLPMTLTGGNKNTIFFTPNLYFTETGFNKIINDQGFVIITTPDKLTYKLSEGEGVNILLNKKLYFLKVQFNKKQKPVYTLSKA